MSKCVKILLFIVIFKGGSLSIGIAQDNPLSPVIELFTSEGCSGCPAADELLKEISLAREKEGKPVLALAFHVTYWNRLGWIDSFSNEQYTARQKFYVDHKKVAQLYTPQAIVNGAHEFVGSNRIAFGNALSQVEGDRASFQLTASAEYRKDSIYLSYKVDRAPRGALLNVAVVEISAERKVTRGENRSRTLKHFNVVRYFTTLKLRRAGFLTFPAVPALSTANSQIVLYIQELSTLDIVAAVKISIEEKRETP